MRSEGNSSAVMIDFRSVKEFFYNSDFILIIKKLKNKFNQAKSSKQFFFFLFM